MMNNRAVTGVVSTNSIAYVDAIFDSYARDEIVVLLRDKDDERIELLGVDKVIQSEQKFGWHARKLDFRNDDALAQIAFTSGTEGEPKGVKLTHRALSDVVSRLNAVMEVDSGIREYVGIPANFSFGFGRFRAVSAIGGRAFLPEQGFNPFEIKQMLLAEEINAISAVPSLWRSLLKNSDMYGDECENVKWIEIGSQYMSQAEKEALKRLFPKAVIVQHYGLTEASRSSFLRIDQTEGALLESVGKAWGETEFKISSAGNICIRGPHVARELIKNGETVSNVDQDDWFHTSDLGRLENGYLYFDGRADDQINVGGIKLSPDSLERKIREQLKIKDGICVSALPDEHLGHVVLVAVLPEHEKNIRDITEYTTEILKSAGVMNPNALKVDSIDKFPLTATNKVQRKQLAKSFLALAKNSSKNTIYVAPTNDVEIALVSIWEKLLKRSPVGVDDNFFDLGGDSLLAVMATLEISNVTGQKLDVGQLFANPTIKKIADIIVNGTISPVSSVVELQAAGDKTPLYCIFGINLYQHLADCFKEDTPVYGVYVSEEQRLLNSDSKTVSSGLAVKLAEQYTDTIIRHNEHGPIQLAGISFGGVVAIEVARLLEQQGRTVEVVFVLDSILREGVILSTRKKVQRMLRELSDELTIKLNRFNILKTADKDLIDKQRKIIFRKAMESLRKKQSSYDGKVVLIKASDQSSWGPGVTFLDDYGWGRYLTDVRAIHTLETDHLGMLDENNVRNLALVLKQYM
ncbi:rfbL protein [Methylophaga lonarensis MPL]|uniref:RfbL protein n=1 Tax=Methylophaga lonarensis MPL TaxID=1286106 RepID=M7PKG4_9GAMM|nr:AMP-binding protein [Methylophaga lonarensis]EMR14355.1 rfbL protein [Methylophaga lonarensis MPL]